LADFARRRNITFPLLADPGSRTIEAYGIRDPQGDGIPHPGTFLVDRDGIIRAKLFEHGYQKRHPTDALIERARKLAASASASEPGARKIAAPELQGIEAWINSKPFALKDLRGKVVVLHFWTFG
jgi:peroxiredoxin